jgi:hypothetical protein
MNLFVLKLTSYTFGIIDEEKVASKSKHKTKKFEKIKRKAQTEQRKCQKKAFHATQPTIPSSTINDVWCPHSHSSHWPCYCATVINLFSLFAKPR